MNRFAALLDRLMYEPRRNAKLRLMADYFRHTPDPDRGWALTGALMFKEAKPNVIRGLAEERVDPVLFRMSYHYVGDLAEATALIWPKQPHPSPRPGGADLGAASPREGEHDRDRQIGVLKRRLPSELGSHDPTSICRAKRGAAIRSRPQRFDARSDPHRGRGNARDR